MRRHRLSLELESLESLTLLSGVKPALTPAHVAVLPRGIPSAEHLPISVAVPAGKSPRFDGPAAGAPRYRRFAPTMVDASSGLINEPLGPKRAEWLAKRLGLKRQLCFTEKQYLLFTNGKGNNGTQDAATIFNQSVAILTNSSANPLPVNISGTTTQIVLGSYGLTVVNGMLMSCANLDSPSRIVNEYLGPHSYLTKWCRTNGAEQSLRGLRQSAYLHQILFGQRAQQVAGAAQLAAYGNAAGSPVAGLSMTPALWEINFCLIYTLKPSLAYDMPAYWTPIPRTVEGALLTSPDGQVPYSDYASYFN